MGTDEIRTPLNLGRAGSLHGGQTAVRSLPDDLYIVKEHVTANSMTDGTLVGVRMFFSGITRLVLPVAARRVVA